MGIFSEEEVAEFKLLEAEKNGILAWEEAKWRQKNRAILLQQGDENTNIFHNYNKMRKSHNSIWDIGNSNGNLVSKFHDIAETRIHFFQSLYNKPPLANIEEIIVVFLSYFYRL